MKPELTTELAEVAGTLMGDGCLSKYWSNYDCRQRQMVLFTGSSDEVEYYTNFVQPIIGRYFGVRGRVFIRKDNGKQSSQYCIMHRKVFNFFCALGIPCGKKSHTVFIPSLIFENKELLRACLRGLWDTDGCVYRRYTKRYKGHARWYPNYLVLQYKTASEKLIFGMKKALDSFSIHSGSILKTKNNVFVLNIYTQSEIKKFLDVIGFRNQHHLNRLARFRSQGI